MTTPSKRPIIPAVSILDNPNSDMLDENEIKYMMKEAIRSATASKEEG